MLPFRPMERRSFLKAAGGGVVVALGAGGYLFSRQTKMIAAGEPLVFFTPREYSIFHSVAEALLDLPQDAPTIDEIGVAARADRMIGGHPPDSQKDFRRLLALFDNALAGFFLNGTIAPFSQLSVEDRRAVLTRWENHRLGVLRSGFVALKRTAMACYYSHERTWAGIKYPGLPELANQ